MESKEKKLMERSRDNLSRRKKAALFAAGLLLALACGLGVAAPQLAFADEAVSAADENATMAASAIATSDESQDVVNASSEGDADASGLVDAVGGLGEDETVDGDIADGSDGEQADSDNGSSDGGDTVDGVDEDTVSDSSDDVADATDDADAAAQTEADATAQAEAATAEVAEDAAAATTAEYVNMYRLYNPNSGEHFYTSSLYEAMSVTEAGWRYEGVGWVAPKTSAAPVYRLYNPNAGDHHYTQSLEERNWLISLGWNDEGIGWYSDDAQGVAVLRQYNPNATTGTHNFTTSSAENKSLVSAGWNGEGIAWYASNVAIQSIHQGRWIVTAAWGSLERYWLDSTATIAKSRLVDPTTARDSGAGYYAYAKSDGAVVRGKWDNGAGRVYVADNDGRLASTDNGKTGWLVTGLYDGGTLQRYYMDMDAHAACSGFFVVSGTDNDGKFYGLGGEGYVLRGKSAWGSHMMVADNDGKLHDAAGWYVGTAYDSEIQRYYFELVPGIGGFYGAIIGKFTVGDNTEDEYYGREDQGYVVRGYYTTPSGELLYGDNNGILGAPPMSALASRAWQTIQNLSSDTQYLIAVDAENCYTFVFQGSAGNWSLLYEWICTTGNPIYNGGQGTWRGVYKIGVGVNGADTPDVNWTRNKEYGTGLWGYRAEYYAPDYVSYFTCFNLDLGFHSCYGGDLGQRISHGCVRLEYDNAKWIYYNATVGTTVAVIPYM